MKQKNLFKTKKPEIIVRYCHRMKSGEIETIVYSLN